MPFFPISCEQCKAVFNKSVPSTFKEHGPTNQGNMIVVGSKDGLLVGPSEGKDVGITDREDDILDGVLDGSVDGTDDRIAEDSRVGTEDGTAKR